MGLVGGTILGMITRTARGHSGRALLTGRTETLAYALVHLAALVRVFGPLAAPAHYGSLLIASAVAWSLAFLLYLIVYVPILVLPRIDGRPG
jgi:uncharacterized protein involved in response to NO